MSNKMAPTYANILMGTSVATSTCSAAQLVMMTLMTLKWNGQTVEAAMTTSLNLQTLFILPSNSQWTFPHLIPSFWTPRPRLLMEMSSFVWLKTHICQRGYETSKVQAAINEVSNKDRQSLLQHNENTTVNRVPVVTTYHPVLEDLSNVLKKHMPILNVNKIMADVFKTSHTAAFRRPRNLKDMVVRTKLENPLPNGGFKTKPVQMSDVQT